MKLVFVLALAASTLASCASTTPSSVADAKKVSNAERLADRVGAHGADH